MDMCERPGCDNPLPEVRSPKRKYCGNTCKLLVLHAREKAKKLGEDPDDYAFFFPRKYAQPADEDTRYGLPITRRCRNKDCVVRFVPVNQNQWYHEPACRESTNLYTMEEILAEEASLSPLSNPLEIAKVALGQKNAALRDLSRAKGLQMYLSFDARQMFEENPDLCFPAATYTPPAKAPAPKGMREILLIIGDWQLGKLENGIGIDVMEYERIPRIMEATRQVVQHMRDSGYQIDKVTIASVGDMVEGCYIYKGQNVYGLDKTGHMTDVVRQTYKAAQLQATLAQDVATYVEEVVIEVIRGNHGRTNAKSEAAKKSDNYDLAAGQIGQLFTQNTPNIKWNVHWDTFWGGFEVAGKYVVAQHGDQFQGDVWKFEKILSNYVVADVFEGRPHAVLLGHRHDFVHFRVAGIHVIQNGTIDGGSSWYLESTGRSAPAEQTIVVMGEKHGVEYVVPIYFDKPDKSLLVAA